MTQNDCFILKANVKFAVSRMPMNKDHQDVVDAFYQVLRWVRELTDGKVGPCPRIPG